MGLEIESWELEVGIRGKKDGGRKGGKRGEERVGFLKGGSALEEVEGEGGEGRGRTMKGKVKVKVFKKGSAPLPFNSNSFSDLCVVSNLTLKTREEEKTCRKQTQEEKKPIISATMLNTWGLGTFHPNSRYLGEKIHQNQIGIRQVLQTGKAKEGHEEKKKKKQGAHPGR